MVKTTGLLIFFALVFLTPLGCGDDDNPSTSSGQADEDCACTQAPPGVESDRDCFAQGEDMPAADGCNTCFCEDGGWSCTEMACLDDDANDDVNDDVNDDADDDTDDDEDKFPFWLHATQGQNAGIIDSLGRQVLLRGANFNHLGDYFPTDPSLPTVADLGADDWDDAAAQGMNVVRLVTTWSAWEPRRDEIDEDYLQRVRDAVAEANAREIYVVIDMHQDAWSKFVFTPADEECPEGAHHQKGWDGAPQWATYTDGEATCTPGRREESPAVIRAWDNFYANRDGVRDELAELWGFIAARFADNPGVAGYDLINEPGNGSDIISTRDGLSAFYRSAIDAIRDAEGQAGSPGHIIFFEPSAMGIPPEFSLRDESLVFAPHNYFESIVDGPEGLLDFSFWLYAAAGLIYGTPLWIGEYNCFSDSETNDAWTTRYAALEDRYIFDGGAWWQWEQECGDPHNAMWPPTQEWIDEQVLRCGDARFELRACLNRAFPRATPGRLTAMSDENCDGNLIMAGSTDTPGIADLWIPGDSDTEPTVTGEGIDSFAARRVDGGWRIDVSVGGDYSINVTPADE